MAEVGIRLAALAASPRLQRLHEPPLFPPLHPQEPCALCFRTEVAHARAADPEEVDDDVYTLIARPLRLAIEDKEQQLAAATAEIDALDKSVRELRGKLRDVSVRKQHGLTVAGGSPGGDGGDAGSDGSDGGSAAERGPRPFSESPGMASGDVSSVFGAPPSEFGGSARSAKHRSRHRKRASSPPLVLQLNIQCSCGDQLGNSFLGVSASSGKAQRSGNRRSTVRRQSVSPAAFLNNPSSRHQSLSVTQAGQGGASGLSPASRRTSRQSLFAKSALSSGAGTPRGDEQETGWASIRGAEAPRETVETVKYRFPIFATVNDVRLLEALGAVPMAILHTAQGRTVAWVLRHISSIYDAKHVSNVTCGFERRPRFFLPEFILDVHLRHRYGTRRLVMESCAALLCACHEQAQDPRVEAFVRFTVEYFEEPVLLRYLAVRRAVDDVVTGPEFSGHVRDESAIAEEMSVLVAARACAKQAAAETEPAVIEAYAATLRHVETIAYDVAPARAAAAVGRANLSKGTMAKWSDADRAAAGRAVARHAFMAALCENLKKALDGLKARAPSISDPLDIPALAEASAPLSPTSPLSGTNTNRRSSRNQSTQLSPIAVD
jgi:hypothetical protein